MDLIDISFPVKFSLKATTEFDACLEWNEKYIYIRLNINFFRYISLFRISLLNDLVLYVHLSHVTRYHLNFNFTGIRVIE